MTVKSLTIRLNREIVNLKYEDHANNNKNAAINNNCKQPAAV